MFLVKSITMPESREALAEVRGGGLASMPHGALHAEEGFVLTEQPVILHADGLPLTLKLGMQRRSLYPLKYPGMLSFMCT